MGDVARVGYPRRLITRRNLLLGLVLYGLGVLIFGGLAVAGPIIKRRETD